MNDQTLKNCISLLECRDRIKSVFIWDNSLTHLACAGIYFTKGLDVDVSVLKGCKELLKYKVGPFSNFKGAARSPIVSMLATSKNPEQTLDNALFVYQLLKKEFWTSSYLPLTAMIIAQTIEPAQYENVVKRTRRIYSIIKKEHPFLTSSEDCANCALMALSEKSDDELINDIESCYRILSTYFFSSNAIQSLSHVLALGQGSQEEKCSRVMEIFNGLKAAGNKYGTRYELPTLGVLALTSVPTQLIVNEMIEINQWLSQQRGFGFFSSVTAKQRLMYAGIVALLEYINIDAMQTTAVNSMISITLATEAAMCAAISAGAAANASANSSSN